MCGVAGFLSSDGGKDTEGLSNAVARMTERLSHRGPDDAGVWTDAEAGIALGHRRLSIIDLSPEGHQPMISAAGRYVVIYNGEIYNFRELRRELEAAGAVFRGHSDTEVMLAAIEQWGVVPALQRFVGMFAFALWDRTLRQLTLVRDRLGIKPLYYGWSGEDFVFASELRASCRHPDFSDEIDRDSLAMMLRYGYVPAPHTIYRHMRKLPPGHVLQVSANALGEPESKEFWSAKTVYEAGQASPFDGDQTEAVESFENLLRDAVAGRMIADVPLGALLSGGLDSSTVAAVMQSQSTRPIKTFSVGFHESDFDEAEIARDVASRLGTDHTEYYLSPEDALETVPSLTEIYDEPFGDSSLLPTLLISRIARRDVTVALTGDGGDELFGGYRRYDFAASGWGAAERLPLLIRRGLSAALKIPSERTWDRLFRLLRPIVPANLNKPQPGSRLHALAESLAAEDTHQFYHAVMSLWPDAERVVRDAALPRTILSDPTGMPDTCDMIERLMYVDLMSYLPDDILTKVDRASMAVSLEVRVPLLDHRIVEFAAGLPVGLKRRPGQSKWIMRRVCEKYLPADLFDRPKTGFSVPLADWLRGPLRPWAEELLSDARIAAAGYLDPTEVRRKWLEHVSGHGDRSAALWNVLMFQQWLAKSGPSGA